MAALDQPPAATPPRYRSRVGITILLVALALGPVAWIAQLLIVYAVASHACFPVGAPLLRGAQVGFWWVLLLINLIGIGLAVIAGLTSMRNYRVSQAASFGERGDTRGWELRDRVEGRTQFLAGWGGLCGLMFFIGAIADLVALIVVPPCLG